jgi:lipoate-protein ligase B
MQKELVQHHIDRISSRSQVNDSKSMNSQFITDYTETQPKGVDSVIFVQHEPVYTLGTASDVNFIKQQHAQPVKVVRIERGGEVTYHGPGQLVIYPILDLRGYARMCLLYYILTGLSSRQLKNGFVFFFLNQI